MLVLAITMQVIGSFLFAGGAMLQSLAVKSTFSRDGHVSDNRLTLAGLFKLLLIPKWSLGLLCVLIGAVINFSALAIAPVAVVQPVGVVAVIWSVLFASRIHGHRVSKNLWLAVAITVVGLVGFTLISTQTATGNKEAHLTPLLVSFGVVMSIAAVLSLIAPRAQPWLKAALWSSIGAVLYGMATGMLKATADLILRYHHSFLDPIVLAAIGMLLVGFIGGAWMIQQGYASGPAEITVATMTTVDPLVAVLFGLIVLGEGQNMTWLSELGMVLTGAVAILGVVLLSHHHPDALKEREARAKEADLSQTPAAQ